MRTTHPLPHTRLVEMQSRMRRGIIKWSSTAGILFAFVRWCSMQSGLAAAICRFTLQTTLFDSKHNTKSNCCSTSARHVPVERSWQWCSMYGLVIIVTLIVTSHCLCFCVIRRIASNSPDMFSKICSTVKLIVLFIIMCIWSGAQGDPTEALYFNQARSITLCRNECSIATESWRMLGEIYHVLQETISRSSFCDKVMSGNLSESRFLH